MNYGEAIRFLYDLRLFGVKLGLENTLALAARAGNPHRRLRFIHVAGTNGKGSTCAMLEGIYRAGGRRVGLFTSPHLVRFNERIQVDRRPIPEADVVRLIDRMRPWLSEFPADRHPTFFEVVTVLALQYFAEQECDLVVWETGMGGRLDATNIVTPLASLITNVQFDHQRWLGDTHSSIAAEKAGIIKPGIPVLTGADEPDAFAVIADQARRLGAPLIRVQAGDPALDYVHAVRLPLLGEHQCRNAALAVATVEALQPRLSLDPSAVRQGLEHVRWPGRLQQVTLDSGCRLILDGAHNLAGTVALRTALEQHFPGIRPTLVLGILLDKDWPHMCEVLAPLARRVLVAPVRSDRSAPPAKLGDACRLAHPGVEPQICGSLAEALEAAVGDPLVLITGSLYLVGEAMEWLHIQTVNGDSEANLNEALTLVPSTHTP